MQIKNIMTREVRTCSPATSVAAAAALMLDGDCGILPVVDDGTLVGVVTDRDMYIALATRNTPASRLIVGEVARRQVWTCAADDDVHAALATMKQHRVRRLPVVGFGDVLVGMVSMNDLLLAAGARKAIRSDEVVDTLRAICAHHHPTPHVAAA
jgi:CBS domain-containing protein